MDGPVKIPRQNWVSNKIMLVNSYRPVNKKRKRKMEVASKKKKLRKMRFVGLPCANLIFRIKKVIVFCLFGEALLQIEKKKKVKEVSVHNPQSTMSTFSSSSFFVQAIQDKKETTRPILTTISDTSEVSLRYFEVKISLWSQIMFDCYLSISPYHGREGQVPRCYLVNTSATLVGNDKFPKF